MRYVIFHKGNRYLLVSMSGGIVRRASSANYLKRAMRNHLIPVVEL